MPIYTKNLTIDDLVKNGLDVSRITNNENVRTYEIWNNKCAGVYIYTKTNKVYVITFNLWEMHTIGNKIKISLSERYVNDDGIYFGVCEESDIEFIQATLDKCLNLINI